MLAAFEDAAIAHFANAPDTWQVHLVGRRQYAVLDAHGMAIEMYPSRAQACLARHSGPAATSWYRRTDWYLGYDLRSRPLTGAEQVIIADITDQLAPAAAIAGQQRVRFAAQHPRDRREFIAAQRTDGRWQIHGHLYSYAADELHALPTAYTA